MVEIRRSALASLNRSGVTDLRPEPSDAGFAELLDDGVVELAPDRQAFLDLRHDATQLEFELRFSEGHQVSGGRRSLNDLRVRIGYVGQDVADPIRIGLVADSDLDHD